MNKKGVTIASLLAMIVIISMVITTVTISVSATAKAAKLKVFATELNMVQNAVTEYRFSHSSLGYVINELKVDINEIDDFEYEIINDGKITLYSLNLSELNLAKTMYGNGLDTNDVYAVSLETGKVYYLDGYAANNKVYYTLTEELQNMLAANEANLSNDMNNIIFVPSSVSNTSEAVSVIIKIPVNIDITSVVVTTDNSSSVSNATLNDGYNQILVNGSQILGSYTINVSYIPANSNTQKTITYYVNNSDRIPPTITVGGQVLLQESDIKYIMVNNVAVQDTSNIAMFKYTDMELTKIEADEYFKTNGIDIKGDKIYLNNASNKYTLYAKDVSGNSSIYILNKMSSETAAYDGSWNSTKGVNSPLLYTGMTGIYWDTNGNEVIVTDSNYSEWYDYSSQKWANAKTADGSYWVWIPRYAYKFESGRYTSTAGVISIKFLQGKTNLDSNGSLISTSYPSWIGSTMESYVVHPAFIDDSSSNFMHGGWDAELAGIWIAKYEMSNDGSGNMVSKPGVQSWRSVAIGDIYTKCINYMSSMQSHMVKNSEWGAVAYLTQSSFGRNSTEVTINSNGNYYTGGSQNATANTNVNQSTTGNNTGIFDMTGGSWEYVAGYISNGDSNISTYGSSFASTTALTTGYQTLSTKYVTVYPYNSSSDSNANNYTIYQNAAYGYGDAILETSTAGSGTTSWYLDYSCYANSSGSFMLRGGNASFGTKAGLFCFDYSRGRGSNDRSFRTVLAEPLKPKYDGTYFVSGQ